MLRAYIWYPLNYFHIVSRNYLLYFLVFESTNYFQCLFESVFFQCFLFFILREKHCLLILDGFRGRTDSLYHQSFCKRRLTGGMSYKVYVVWDAHAGLGMVCGFISHHQHNPSLQSHKWADKGRKHHQFIVLFCLCCFQR